ncbi:AraC family transcriptional regulator [Sphingobacterium sp. T2]|uniref:AraC family transcriptional regulator n=1 Tax=Sphingobacterium sp. T2 TaxID=1590596 RepID=UPI00057B885B|nr:AraC family transcriptional regulator [Sphingobacterium sp. T2]
MKIKRLSLQDSFHKSLHVRRDTYPQHHQVWHYHDEVEFIYIIKGTGTLFVGDCIQTIVPGNCVLIGSNLPHYWMFDENYLIGDSRIDCIVIHFHPHFLGENFFQIKELKILNDCLLASGRALFLADTDKRWHSLFHAILEEEHVLKITGLLNALYYFQKENPHSLVSKNYAFLNHSLDEKRMNDVIQYIKQNYRHKVELQELAALARMTKNSFCRYFKQKTGKTPIQFVSELRVSHACKLLKSSELNLKEICFDSGFNSFVNSHKIFKSITKTSPKQYQKRHNKHS